MNKKLISIIIPTYNRLNLLKRAVNSAIEQTYANIEIIISDNFSNDGTKEFCEKLLLEKKANIKYIRRDQNIGATLNFHNAFLESRGKYIAFLADDDYIESEYIEKLLNAMKDPKVVHSCSFSNERKPNGEIIRFEEYNFLGEMNDFQIIKCLNNFRINGRMSLLFYGLSKRELILEIFPEPEFTVTMGKKSSSGLEVPYLSRILVKGQIKIVPLRLYNYTGIGDRDGEQSLALNDSSKLNKFDYLIIIIGQLARLIKSLYKMHPKRVSKILIACILISSFAFLIVGKIMNILKKYTSKFVKAM